MKTSAIILAIFSTVAVAQLGAKDCAKEAEYEEDKMSVLYRP